MEQELGDLEFESRQGLGIFLFTASRPALGITQPPIQLLPGVLVPRLRTVEL
jgi:hypothetical protein